MTENIAMYLKMGWTETSRRCGRVWPRPYEQSPDANDNL